jgi:MSHA biogenesis protein MshP
MVKFGTAQQITSSQDILSARAWQAAKAGNEWGIYQALKGAWQTCHSDSATLDLTGSGGFKVTVTCDSTPYQEGESAPGASATVRVYRINAVACNSSAACPDKDKIASPDYVERMRQAVVTN